MKPFLFITLALCMTFHCAHADKIEPEVIRAGKILDKIEETVEEWGHGSFSEILLIEDLLIDGNGIFSIDYNLPASKYAELVRTSNQGASALFKEKFLSNEFTAKATFDSLQKSDETKALLQSQIEVEKARQELNQLKKAGLADTISTNGPPSNFVPLSIKSAGNGENGQTNETGEAGETNETDETDEADKNQNEGDGEEELDGDVNPDTKGQETIPNSSEDELPFADSKFRDFQGLISGESTQISEGDVMKVATSHKISEMLLNYLPHPINLPANKKVFLGITQVSVSPGIRTKNNYFCEVQVNFRYALPKRDTIRKTESLFKAKLESMPIRNLANEAEDFGVLKVEEKESHKLYKYSGSELESCEMELHDLKFYQKQLTEDIIWNYKNDLPDFVESDSEIVGITGRGVEQPFVVSAFPFAEAQVIDQQYSDRNQLSLLMDLAVTLKKAGVNVDLSNITKFVKRAQKDLATKNIFPVVTPSSDGASLTYRIDPAVYASTNPSGSRNGPGNQLLPITIPVLVLVVCEAEELDFWSHVVSNVSTRWIPKENRHWAKKGFFDWWYYSHPKYARFRNTDRLRNAHGFDDILDIMDNLDPTMSDYDELNRRYEALSSVALGMTRFSSLPVLSPKLFSVSPNKIRIDTPSSLTITGENFLHLDQPHVEMINLGGLPLSTRSVEEHKIEVDIPSSGLKHVLEPGKHDLTIQTQGGRYKLSQAVEVIKPPVKLIRSVYPKQLVLDRPSQELVILGEEFVVGSNKLVEQIVVGGVRAEKITILDDKTLIAQMPDHNLAGYISPGKVSVEVFTSIGKTSLPEAVEVLHAKPVVFSPNQYFVRWYDQPSSFVIQGQNFTGQVVGANLGGRECVANVLNDKTVIVVCPPWTPGPNPELAKANKELAVAEKKVLEAGILIAKADTAIADAEARIKKGGKPADIAKAKADKDKAIKEKSAAKQSKELALKDKDKAKADQEIALAKKAAEPADPLDIILLTSQGPLPAGKVRLEYRVTPKPTSKPATSQNTSSNKPNGSSTKKIDPAIEIQRNDKNEIIGVIAKGDFESASLLLKTIQSALGAESNQLKLSIGASGAVGLTTDAQTSTPKNP